MSATPAKKPEPAKSTPAKSAPVKNTSLSDLLGHKKKEEEVNLPEHEHEPVKSVKSDKTDESDKSDKSDKSDSDDDHKFDNDEDYDDDEDMTEEEKTKHPTVVRPEDIKPPVDNTDKSGLNTSFDDSDKADKPVISNQVVGTVPNKTPAELAAETGEQTAARYGIDQTITDEDADNPNVQAYRDTRVNQVPSGTHLHPDIAKDMLNRGISEQTTDSAQVKRTTTEYYSFAADAEHNDKF